jgi:hypothetical protein
MPPLDGYVAAAARPTAEVILQSHLGDAVFAGWRYGLGRVALFTAEPTPAFASWPGTAALWTQAARWLARGRDAALLRAGIVPGPDGVKLAVEARATDGSYANGLTGTAAVRAPDGEQRSIQLRQVAPGRYEGQFQATTSGAYRAAIALGDDDGTAMHALAGTYWSAATEQPGLPPDHAFLERLATATGGRVLREGDNPFTAPRPAEYVDARPMLALVALLLFVCEVAARKGFTPSMVASVWRAGRRHNGKAESVTA